MITDGQSFAASGAQFTSTRWSVVLSAREASGDAGRKALEKLCSSYWPAIYSFLRRKGHSPEDAKDLTQDFFAMLLRRDTFGAADPQRGRFRSFLLECLRHFLVDELRRACSQKRGGGQRPISFDDPDQQSYLEPVSPETSPEELYDRRWRSVLLQQAIKRLEQEFTGAGKQRHFELLKEFLTASATSGAYHPVATALGASPQTIAVTIHRMRQRFREIVREELAQTVASRAEFDLEARTLFGWQQCLAFA
jgi:RNA polymerase sigma-70 factor (ECF subfamily)